MVSPKFFAIERFHCMYSYKNGMYNKMYSDLNSLDCLFIFITVKRKVGKDSSSDATGPPRNPKYSQVLLPFSNSVPIIRNKISQIGHTVK